MNGRPPTDYASLMEPLIEAAAGAARPALTLLGEDGSRTTLDHAALDAAARSRMAGLAAAGIRRGDVVVLVMGHSLDLITLTLGAMYLGAVPSILAYPTPKLDVGVWSERIRGAVRCAAARAVIASSLVAERLRGVLGDHGVLLAADQLHAAPTAVPAATEPTAPAFIQFTSGTTSAPRGILHTHARVLRYIAARAANDHFVDDDVIVSWLPLYHDLGLVSGLFTPLVVGIPTVLMSPVHWVKEPRILLRAIHAFRGTRCWMPNFALNHCARNVRPRDLEGIDLAHWRALVLGGEPVRPASMRLFVDRFAANGFREDALMAGYGMAENVEAATATRRGSPPPVDCVLLNALHEEGRAIPAPPVAGETVSLTSCGPPLPECEITIRGPDGSRLPERHVGEVILRSPWMFEGYLGAGGASDCLRDGWFHTGDLGYLADGQLYVCGRMKDLVIVGGRNIHPHDLEYVADEIPGLRPGRCVAFGVEDERLGSERLVMVCEIAPGLDEGGRLAIERELRRRLVQELDVTLGDLLLVDGPWVVKTSSGKTARAANRDKYLAVRLAQA